MHEIPSKRKKPFIFFAFLNELLGRKDQFQCSRSQKRLDITFQYRKSTQKPSEVLSAIVRTTQSSQKLLPYKLNWKNAGISKTIFSFD